MCWDRLAVWSFIFDRCAPSFQNCYPGWINHTNKNIFMAECWGRKLLCCLVLQYNTQTKFTLLHRRYLLSIGAAGSTQKWMFLVVALTYELVLLGWNKPNNSLTFTKLSRSSSICLCDICHVLACFIYTTRTNRHLHYLHNHHITLWWNIAVICSDSTDIGSSVQA